MAVNSSKIRSPGEWRKWYQSGAIAQPKFPDGSLVIDAIASHFESPATGHQTLSLGRRTINSGPGWEVSEPLCAVVVPSSRFELGQVLKRIPGNAVPLELFFPPTPEKKYDEEIRSDRETSAPKATKPKVSLRHPHYNGRVTLIEKEGGWSNEEVSTFVELGTECERQRKFPNRLVVAAVVENDEIRTILGHNKFTARQVSFHQKWD